MRDLKSCGTLRKEDFELSEPITFDWKQRHKLKQIKLEYENIRSLPIEKLVSIPGRMNDKLDFGRIF